MNQENWNQSSSWYEPMPQPEPAPQPVSQPEPQSAPVKAKKQKKRWPRVLGGVLLSLAVIIGLSVAFREEAPAEAPGLPEFRAPHSAATPAPSDDGGEESADGEKERKKDDTPSFREFFDSIYQKDEAENVKVGIPPAKAVGDFRMALDGALPDELSLQQLYERCYPSVVGISGYAKGRLGYSWGSGVILSEDGLIITNTHVIDGCDSATVTLFDDREFEARLIGYDSISDVALLKIAATGLPAASFGDSAALTVGQRVAAIGNPLGEEFRMTLTDGIISGISRDINYKGRTMTLLQTNTALNGGNSGGALFNMSGQVIGITNMKMDAQGGETTIEGIGFAIPTSTVLSVVNALLENGKVVGRVSIGITVGPIPESAAADYDLPDGLYIVSVEKGSDAQKKGLRDGDILMEVNGEPVTETKRLAEIKDAFSVGDELEFKVWRDGKTFTVKVALMDTNDVYG